MRHIHCILLVSLSFFILLSNSAWPETQKPETLFEIQDGEIKIASITWKLSIKDSKITFNGDVKVEGNDMIMSCQKLELFFTDKAADDSKEGKYQVEKIVAIEEVVIERLKNGGLATAERAEYIRESGKIILTGNPVFQDGEGRGGSAGRIILDLNDESYIAEGTKEEKAKFFSSGKVER